MKRVELRRNVTGVLKGEGVFVLAGTIGTLIEVTRPTKSLFGEDLPRLVVKWDEVMVGSRMTVLHVVVDRNDVVPVPDDDDRGIEPDVSGAVDT